MANTVIASASDSNMVDSPLWMQATGGDSAIQYAAADDRVLLDTVWPNEGVLTTASFKVSQRGAGANFSVDVAAGRAVVTGDDGSNQRKYIVLSNGTVNVVTPSAPGSGTRVHRIIIRIRDKQVIGSGTYDWTLELLEDTGSGTPAQPNSAITIATVSIASGQASVTNTNIVDLRPLGTTAPIVRGSRPTSSTTTTTEVGVLRLDSIPTFAGHAYEVSTSPLLATSTVGNDLIQVAFRASHSTTTAVAATTSSTPIHAQVDNAYSGGGSQKALLGMSTIYIAPATGLLSVLLTVGRGVGATGTIGLLVSSPLWPTIDMLVKDLGPDGGDVGVDI